MKSIKQLINESQNGITLNIDNKPDFDKTKIHIIVASSGEPFIMFGKPCTKDMSSEYKEAYNLAKPFFGKNTVGYSNPSDDIEKVFSEYEDEIPELNEDGTKICLCLSGTSSGHNVVPFIYDNTIKCISFH